MKRLLVILIALGMATTSIAQTKVRTPKRVPVRTVIVAAPVYPSYGLGLGYGARWGSPFYRPYYDPFYDPFYRQRHAQRETLPSELQLHLDEISNEYDHRIAKTKDELKGKERRQAIRELRFQKEDALIKAKKSFVQRKQQEQKKEIES